MSSVQTDNTYFEIKVRLREDNLPPGKCFVLDCFSSNSRIWNTIKKRNPGRQIKVLRIEKAQGKKGVYLLGDNRKYLQALNLDQFNIIDLDAYGIPYDQLRMLFENAGVKRKVVFMTFIQSMYGALPLGLLEEIGYSKAMLSKCKSIFSRHSLKKLKQYLASKGIKELRYYALPGNKYYLCFEITKR